MTRLVTLLATSAIALLGCSSEDIETHGVDTAAADAKPAHRYVISRLDVPDQPIEIDQVGFDLDADQRHRIDNKAGALIEMTEANFVSGLQAHVDGELAAGRMNTMIELHSDGFGDQLDVALELRPAVREDVGLRAASLRHPLQRIYGRIHKGRFVTMLPGQISIELAMFAGQAPLAVELIGARVEGRVGPDGLTDLSIGGGLPRANVERDFANALHRLVVERVANSTDMQTVLIAQLFDTDKDGVITAPEFMASNMMQTFLSPDVDLVEDAALPFFAPGPDGHKECISLGLRADATPLGF